MLPSTPEGVLLQGGDARREPPIVLARRAGTPYRNGHLISCSVAHPLEPAAPTAGSWHFRGGCAKAGARSCWSPPLGVTARPGAGPGSAPGRRHDRPRGASPQAVSTGWRRLLPDRANAAPRRSPPVLLPAAAPGHGPDLGQAPPGAPPPQPQDGGHGAEDAPEREARLCLGHERVQPPH